MNSMNDSLESDRELEVCKDDGEGVDYLHTLIIKTIMTFSNIRVIN